VPTLRQYAFIADVACRSRPSTGKTILSLEVDGEHTVPAEVIRALVVFATATG